MSDSLPQVVVAQLGARMHYAVPRILHEAGMLGHFYTDICATKGWPRLLRNVPIRLRPKGLRRLLGRVPHDVPDDKITAFTAMGWRHARTLAACTSIADFTAKRLAMFGEFGRRVVEHGFGDSDACYTFNCAGLEIMQAAKDAGLKTVMEQTIAPAAIEQRLLAEEASKHADWPSPLLDAAYPEKIGRETAEWQLADIILCGSEFVRDGIVAAGGPGEKCSIVPYGVDIQEFPLISRQHHDGPLRVLTIGEMGFRKGTPYVLEAARQMQNEAIFRLVGPGNLPPAVRHRLSANVELVGQVPRSEIRTHFIWADVFLLPSICEGSATVTYEALLTGLPVICTPNTGSMVRDGIDGTLVAARSVDGNLASAVVAVLRKWKSDGFAARADRHDLGLTAYANRLCAAIASGKLRQTVKTSVSKGASSSPRVRPPINA